MVQEAARDIADAVRRDIFAKIETGALEPGAQLPTERELAANYDTSRAVVRRGLDALRKDGWITRNVGRGTFVADRPGQAASPGPLADVSPADLAIARLMVEPSIAEYAAVHATPSDLRAIEECLRKAEQAADPLEFERWDARLHAAIAAAAHNRFLTFVIDAVDEVRQSPDWRRSTVSASAPARREIHSRDHRLIVEALIARDPVAARKAMRRHIQKVIQFMLGASSPPDLG